MAQEIVDTTIQLRSCLHDAFRLTSSSHGQAGIPYKYYALGRASDPLISLVGISGSPRAFPTPILSRE